MTKRSKQAVGRPAPVDGGKLYYRIGEVSRLTGVKPYVLRYWESEFRWMAPGKSRSQQRLYRQRDIDVILLIKKLLYEERFTIAGARKRLRELGVARASEAPGRDAASAAERDVAEVPAREALPEPVATLEPLQEGDLRARVQRIRMELESIRALL
jgi:DNA-binding transcriptional MerR regulator